MAEIQELERLPLDFENTYLITHKDCLDGAGAACVFTRAGGIPDQIIYTPAGCVDETLRDEIPYIVASDAFLIICDVAPSVEWAMKLEKRGAAIILDHHASNMPLSKLASCHVSNELCGAELIFRYMTLHNPIINYAANFREMRWLTRVIHDVEYWKNELRESDELTLLLTLIGQDGFVCRFGQEWGQPWPTDEEARLVEKLRWKRDREAYAVLSTTYKRVVDTDEGSMVVEYCFVSNELASYTLNLMLARKGQDIAVGIDTQKRTVSIRTRPGVDASKFAMKFGGGGHVAAAGHRIDRYFLETLIEELHTC